MTSFILIARDKTKRQKYIHQFCKDRSIDPLDITVIEKETAIKQNINTIGIDEVKNMQKKLFLKPIKSQTKAVILEDAQLLTIEAQNALLKVLEEPPANTIIILSSDSIEPLLATIISRCQIIEIKDKNHGLSEKEIQEATEFLEMLSGMSIGEKLKKAESISKDKQKAKAWIANLIVILREELLEHASSKSPDTQNTFKTLNALQKTHTLLKTTNTNPRFALEIAFLNLI
jgi:DNA polymerase III delta prime subunit